MDLLLEYFIESKDITHFWKVFSHFYTNFIEINMISGVCI